MKRVGINYATYGHWTLSVIKAGVKPIVHYQPETSKQTNFQTMTKCFNFKDDIHCPDSAAKSKAILLENFPKIDYDGTFESFKNMDLICGSPPCIGFSIANQNRSVDHFANKHYIYMYRFISQTKPQEFLVEITPGILKLGNKIFKKALSYIKNDYDYRYDIFQTADYGSPEFRSRVYVFGSRSGKHRLDIIDKFMELKRPWVGCSTVLSLLKQKWDRYTPDNRVLMSRYLVDGMTLRQGPYRHANRKLIASRPSWTITGGSYCTMLHYGHDRFLSLDEIKTLIGFSPNYNIDPLHQYPSISIQCQVIASGIDIPFTKQLLSRILK